MEPDVPNQEETTAGQLQHAPIRRGETFIRCQAARERPPVFLKRCLQRASHDAVPIAIDLDFIGGIHGGDRVLAVLNCRYRRFQKDINYAGGMRLANGMFPVNLHFNVQPVVLE